ncbi:peptidoglycan-binding domain-containing protein [Streptomyces sp. NPDC054841]
MITNTHWLGFPGFLLIGVDAIDLASALGFGARRSIALDCLERQVTMSRRSRIALAVGSALLCGSIPLAVPASAAETPSSTKQGVYQPTSGRCLVWWKETANYNGATAGYSWAWNVTVSPGATGDRVREIQCLLDHWRVVEGSLGGPLNPGALDGHFGAQTKKAVMNLQRHWCGFADGSDGVVGPPTWRCLRSVYVP